MASRHLFSVIFNSIKKKTSKIETLHLQGLIVTFVRQKIFQKGFKLNLSKPGAHDYVHPSLQESRIKNQNQFELLPLLQNIT